MEAERKGAIYKKCLKEIKKSLKGKILFEKMTVVCQILKANIPYYFWVGFYIPKETFLELGPSEGPPACAQIAYTGVCGKAVYGKKTLIVPNVHDFPGHVVCDPRSKSEIAVPVLDKSGRVIAVLDVDSEEFGSFDEIDKKWLEKLVKNL